MIALLVATLEEAQPLLALLRAEPLVAKPFGTYWFPAGGRRPAGLVVISGMGRARAAAAAEYAVTAHGADVLVNVGICGALDSALLPGTVCRSASVGAEASLARGLAPEALAGPAERWPDLRAVRLVTVDEPVFGGARRDALAGLADVVDMEGSAVAEVCRRRGVPCSLLKGVSDGAGAGGRDELLKNLSAVAESLARCVDEGLARFPREQDGLLARGARFVKVEHTIFSLPLLFAGAWLGAGGHLPSLRLLALVALAGLGARTLGMAMNRILDRHIDLLNPRTRDRELPSGRMSPRQAWGVAAAGLAVYLAACALLGPVCLRLSPVPAVLLTGYSLLKRVTPLCHFGLGVCLALGPLCAFVATSGGTALGPAALALALFTFCWISGFDVIYALQDFESDRRNGVRSLPAALGRVWAQRVAALVHLVALCAAVWLWLLVGGVPAGLAPLLAAAVAFGLAYWERLPLPARFFPVSAVAGLAGALIPFMGAP